MSDIQKSIIYINADSALGKIVDAYNQNLVGENPVPAIVLGTEMMYCLRLMQDGTAYPYSAVSGMASWDCILDDDWDSNSTPLLAADNANIKVVQNEAYTEIQIPILETNTEELKAVINNSETVTINLELCGFVAGKTKPSFVLQVKGLVIRNRIGAAGTGTPVPVDDGSLSAAQIIALLKLSREHQFSKDGVNWHEPQTVDDNYMQERYPGGEWSETQLIPRGRDGIEWYNSVVRLTAANADSWMNLVERYGFEPLYYSTFRPGRCYFSAKFDGTYALFPEVVLNGISFDANQKAEWASSGSARFAKASASYINAGTKSWPQWGASLTRWCLSCYFKPSDAATAGTIFSFADWEDSYTAKNTEQLMLPESYAANITPAPEWLGKTATWNETLSRWVVTVKSGEWSESANNAVNPFSVSLSGGKIVLKYHNLTFTGTTDVASLIGSDYNGFIPIVIRRTDAPDDALEMTTIEVWLKGNRELVAVFDAKHSLSPMNGIWLGALPFSNTEDSYFDGWIDEVLFRPQKLSDERPLVSAVNECPYAVYDYVYANPGEITTIPAHVIFVHDQTGEIYFTKKSFVVDRTEE